MAHDTKNYPETKFIIFGIQRTGTIFLMHLLDSHPDILCIGEAFQDISSTCHKAPDIPRFKLFVLESFFNRIINLFSRRYIVNKYLKYIFSSYRFNTIGFKLMLNQYLFYSGLKDNLKSNNYKIIHLVRSNLLKTYISRLRAIQTGLYVSEHKQSQIKITVPPGTLLKNLENLEIQNQKLVQSVADLGLPSHTVFYENLQNNTQEEVKTILGFLGVDSSRILTPRSKKITSDDLTEVIDNYDEIYSLLQNSNYGKYIS